MFKPERGKHQRNNNFHFQGYIKFKRTTDIIAFERKLAFRWNKKDVFFSFKEYRKGTEQQAIDYVKKEQSKLYDKFFEFGIPKKQGREIIKYNKNEIDIPKDSDGQLVLLKCWLKEDKEKESKGEKKRYNEFEEIEKDFPLLFVKHENFIKRIWEKLNPINISKIKPLRVIWVYGHSGMGKSTWIDNFLYKKMKYSGSDVCYKTYEGTDKVWFQLEDEHKKVLQIEEVRENFPDNNKLISLISKKNALPVKGSLIKNNFELLIIASLHSPEMVYSSLKIGNQVEVLRRLYMQKDNKVIQLIYGKDENNPENSYFNNESKRWVTIYDRTHLLPKNLIKHLEFDKEGNTEDEEDDDDSEEGILI